MQYSETLAARLSNWEETLEPGTPEHIAALYEFAWWFDRRCENERHYCKGKPYPYPIPKGIIH